MSPTDALAAALAVEQQVVYGYGVAGAHLTRTDRAAAAAALAVHESRRDLLTQLLLQATRSPAPAQPAYTLPFPVTAPAAARRLCALLEDAVAGAAYDLAAASGAGQRARALAVTWLADAAVRAARWRGNAPVPPLPGRH